MQKGQTFIAFKKKEDLAIRSLTKFKRFNTSVCLVEAIQHETISHRNTLNRTFSPSKYDKVNFCWTLNVGSQEYSITSSSRLQTELDLVKIKSDGHSQPLSTDGNPLFYSSPWLLHVIQFSKRRAFSVLIS